MEKPVFKFDAVKHEHPYLAIKEWWKATFNRDFKADLLVGMGVINRSDPLIVRVIQFDGRRVEVTLNQETREPHLMYAAREL